MRQDTIVIIIIERTGILLRRPCRLPFGGLDQALHVAIGQMFAGLLNTIKCN